MNDWLRLLSVLTLTLASCRADPRSSESFCKITSPGVEPPDSISLIYDQMPYVDTVSILGELGYSPTEGQYYYATGGDCSLDGSGGHNARGCGYVLEYRDYERQVEPEFVHPDNSRRFTIPFLPDNKSDWRLQSCSWGGIGE